MSWQAMEAVQDHSHFEPGTGLSIMYALARSADANGIVGADGRLTAPNVETIAERAHVSKGTVLNWLPKLEESGEVKVERFGKGRGKWNRYTILLPMPEEQPAEEKEPEPDPIEERLDRLERTVQTLVVTVQESIAAMQVMVQETVQNGTSMVVPDTKDTINNTPPKSPPAEKNGGDVVVADVFTAYQNEIGTMSKIISDNIADACEEFGPQPVIDAIEQSAKSNVRKWSYVEGILSNWRVNGRHQKHKRVGSIVEDAAGGFNV